MASLYRRFHGRKPREWKRVKVAAWPKKLEALGEVVAVVYRTPFERVPYEHKFKRPRPVLATDAKGKRLYLVGGGYRVTARGIVN